MTITELMPVIDSLPHADKFKLMQFLLDRLAGEEGISLQTRFPEKDDALRSIVGMAEGDDADVARHHDEYLYGAK